MCALMKLSIVTSLYQSASYIGEFHPIYIGKIFSEVKQRP
jgi:hypothetical protein